MPIETIGVRVEVNNAVLQMLPDPTMPLRFLKEEALALVPPLPYSDIEVWLGPEPGRKLQDALSLATQGVKDQATIYIRPRITDRPPSRQEQLANKIVTAAVDNLIKRGALRDCNETVIHGYVLAAIAAALQGLVATGELQPWQDDGSHYRHNTIRPELDTFVWAVETNGAGEKFGPGHFGYGYFFHVNDIETNVPQENKRCYGFYRLDASQWLTK